jgi:fatty acid desaturase
MRTPSLGPVARVIAAVGAVLFGASAVLALYGRDWWAGLSLGGFAATCVYGAYTGIDLVVDEAGHRSFRRTRRKRRDAPPA